MNLFTELLDIDTQSLYSYPFVINLGENILNELRDIAENEAQRISKNLEITFTKEEVESVYKKIIDLIDEHYSTSTGGKISIFENNQIEIFDYTFERKEVTLNPNFGIFHPIPYEDVEYFVEKKFREKFITGIVYGLLGQRNI